MTTQANAFLIAGAALSAIAAAMHLGCIFFGAPWYRFFGAGEKMALMAEAGSAYPTKITLVITLVLLSWSAYALSGAGVLPRLPLLRPVLCAITAVYLLRGFAFYPLMKIIPGNSLTFWLWSAGVCAVFGVVHLIGLKQVWSTL
ncbi:hypothetical protein [Massilia glaciei]|uniref:DUF3995 domain-containing protein n=1 Tax=Massilia glaciei TaxID=1524097 RepID=A0A2U2HP00_9BURK|nr:hypothetical protein [Massilia glaciei]PWF49223.1 hypothetical protein C7C56_007690 [Massilia glaciei]